MTWHWCVVRGNIGEMVNRDRCICLLLMGASKATKLMSSSAADSGHLLGRKSLLWKIFIKIIIIKAAMAADMHV